MEKKARVASLVAECCSISSDSYRIKMSRRGTVRFSRFDHFWPWAFPYFYMTSIKYTFIVKEIKKNVLPFVVFMVKYNHKFASYTPKTALLSRVRRVQNTHYCVTIFPYNTHEMHHHTSSLSHHEVEHRSTR